MKSYLYTDVVVRKEPRLLTGGWLRTVKVGNKYYFGALNEDWTKAYICVWDEDAETLEVIEIPPLAPPYADNHFQPSILRDADGYFYAFSGYLGYGIKVSKTTNPDDVTSWEPAVVIVDNGSYPFPWIDPTTGYIYLMFRAANVSPYKYDVYRSTDGGATWSFYANTIWPRGYYPFGGQYYDESTGRLHVAAVGEAVEFTRHNNAYYAFSDDNGLSWKDVLGNTVTSPPQVYTGYTTRVNGLVLYENKPCFVIGYGWRGGSTSDDYWSKFVRWDGTSWVVNTIDSYPPHYHHGFGVNPCLHLINGRMHHLDMIQDSSYYDPDVSKYRVNHYYADPPFDSWTLREGVTIWMDQKRHCTCAFPTTEFPIILFYPHRPPNGGYEIHAAAIFETAQRIWRWDGTRQIQGSDWNTMAKVVESIRLGHTHDGINSAEIAGLLAYEDMVLIDVIRCAIGQFQSWTNTTWTTIGGSFRVLDPEKYKLKKGAIVWKFVAMLRQDTSGYKAHARLYDQTAGQEVWGSEIVVDTPGGDPNWTYLQKRSEDLSIEHDNSLVVQVKVDGGTGRAVAFYIFVFAKF